MDLKYLPLNQRAVAVDNDTIRVFAIRISANSAIVTWEQPKSNRELLRTRVDVFTGHATMEFYDSSFWTITINGLPKTSADLDQLAGKSLSFNADPSSRSLQVTTNV